MTQTGQGDVPLRVLLVDDHDLFRTGLRRLLAQEGFAVTDAASGAGAIAACRTARPDVVVMDMNMPGMSGIEATAAIVAEHPRLAVLVLTVAADEERVIEAVRAGACGYLLKDARLPEIVAGVRTAAAGESVLATKIAGALLDSVRRGPAPGERPTTSAGLSSRERDVLALLAEGYDNADIAGQLYVSPSTVKNHVSRLLDKLGVENRVQAAAVAIRQGLVD